MKRDAAVDKTVPNEAPTPAEAPVLPTPEPGSDGKPSTATPESITEEPDGPIEPEDGEESVGEEGAETAALTTGFNYLYILIPVLLVLQLVVVALIVVIWI